MVHTKKFNSPCGGDLSKELMWKFDTDYVTRNNRRDHSYLHLSAMLCILSVIALNHVINVKCPDKFLCTVL